MGEWDTILGVILLATWVNCSLLTLEIAQMWFYFKTYSDGKLIKGAVILSLFFDLLACVGEYSTVYLDCITHFGDGNFARHSPWGVPLAVLATGCSAIICQFFLIWRLFKLANNYVASIALVACALAGLAGALGVTIVTFGASNIDQRHSFGSIIIIWLTASAGTDIFIAGSLVWYLQSISTSFDATEGLLKRLSRSAVETGSATSAIALAGVICFLIFPANNLDLAFVFILGRVYAMTLLYNLNQRKALATDHSVTKPSDVDFSHGRIHVTRHAVTHTDGPDGSLSGFQMSTARNTAINAGRPPKTRSYSSDGEAPFHVELEDPARPDSVQDEYMYKTADMETGRVQ